MDQSCSSGSKESSRESGASMLEYVLVGILIAVVCVAGVKVVGTATSKRFSSIASGVSVIP